MIDITDRRAEAGQIVTWACIVELHQKHAINTGRFEALADALNEWQAWYARQRANGSTAADRALYDKAADVCDPYFAFPGKYDRGNRGAMLRREVTSAASAAWQLMALSIHDAYGYKPKAMEKLKQEVKADVEELAIDFYAKTDLVKDGSGWKKVENRDVGIEKLRVAVSDALGCEVKIIDEKAWRRTATECDRITQREKDLIAIKAFKAKVEKQEKPLAVLSTKARAANMA